MTVFEFKLKNKELMVREAPEFRRTFNRNLKDFFDYLTGFDLIAFDDQVVKPEFDVSTIDTVRVKWGDTAVALCQRLIVGVS